MMNIIKRRRNVGYDLEFINAINNRISSGFKGDYFIVTSKPLRYYKLLKAHFPNNIILLDKDKLILRIDD
jgi:hypothetical protein